MPARAVRRAGHGGDDGGGWLCTHFVCGVRQRVVRRLSALGVAHLPADMSGCLRPCTRRVSCGVRVVCPTISPRSYSGARPWLSHPVGGAHRSVARLSSLQFGACAAAARPTSDGRRRAAARGCVCACMIMRPCARAHARACARARARPASALRAATAFPRTAPSPARTPSLSGPGRGGRTSTSRLSRGHIPSGRC